MNETVVEWRSVAIDADGDAQDDNRYALRAEATEDARRMVADGDYPAAAVERVEWRIARDGMTVERVRYRTVERHGDEHALNAGGWYVRGGTQ